MINGKVSSKWLISTKVLHEEPDTLNKIIKKHLGLKRKINMASKFQHKFFVEKHNPINSPVIM